MKLPTGLALLMLTLVNTPTVAKTSQACADVNRNAVAIAGVTAVTVCRSGGQSTPVEQLPSATDRCSAASAHVNHSLVALHRSIQAGGLSLLRGPSNGLDVPPTGVERADLAGCRVG